MAQLQADLKFDTSRSETPPKLPSEFLDSRASDKRAVSFHGFAVH